MTTLESIVAKTTRLMDVALIERITDYEGLTSLIELQGFGFEREKCLGPQKYQRKYTENHDRMFTDIHYKQL